MMNPNIINILVHNQQRYKELTRPLKEFRDKLLANENNVFHEDIEDDYLVALRRTIINDISKTYALPYEEVYIVLEAMNLEEYLNTSWQLY